MHSKSKPSEITFGEVKNKEIIFKGCTFDAGWEFDAPCIIYAPFECYDSNGTSIFTMVEDMCINICNGEKVERKFTKLDLKEFKWRGWNPKGFKKRKKAQHEFYKVKFFINEENEPDFEMEVSKLIMRGEE